MSHSNQLSESFDAETALLNVQGLEKYYNTSGDFWDQLLQQYKYVHAVDGVDLTVELGETLAVVGESGCGKSTLARTIIGLETRTSGEICFKGNNITELSGKEKRAISQEIQIIFQDPLSSLNPRQTVGQILTTPMEVHDIGDSKAERLEEAKSLLERVGLKPNHIERYPEQFSGGQQQRIGIARALSVDPELIIADEPVSALDVSVQAQILALLEDLQEEYNLGIMLITHDLSVVRYIADRVAVMYLGEIVESAPTDQIFESPKHPYTEALISAIPRINPDKATDRILLEGDVPSPISPPSACRFHTRCPSIIPPSEWDSDQPTFRSVFSFRTRVLNEEIDPEEIETILEADDADIDIEDVKAYILANSLEVDIDTLPPDVRHVLNKAVTQICDGKNGEAKRLLQKEICSPCAEHRPEPEQVDDQASVSCHLFEE